MDVPALELHVSKQTDRRQDQVDAFLAEVKLHGRHVEGGRVPAINRTYFRKTIDGTTAERLYKPFLLLQSLTREARATACESFSFDIDTVNAFVSTLDTISEGSMPMVRQHAQNVGTWRDMLAEYYGFRLEDAKRVLLKAIMGYCAPPKHTKPDFRGTLPWIEALASEAIKVKTVLATKRPNYVAHLKERAGGTRS